MLWNRFAKPRHCCERNAVPKIWYQNANSYLVTLFETCKRTRPPSQPPCSRLYSIIGLSDGLMVPFALTAGLSSLGDSKLVYQGGLAELVAGSISMGVGYVSSPPQSLLTVSGFLSAQSEQHIFRYRQSTLTKQWLLACPSQIDKKTQELLKPYGVSNTTCHQIAADLSRANLYNVEERKTESGVVPLVLSLEEGLEVVPTKRLIMSATTIGLSYFLGGVIPIIPYFCVSNALQGLYWSIVSLL